jgi:hypothetical protein
MPALGDEFRAAREARHLSLSDVSEQIHIRSVYLQSIEDEDWSAIAAPVYVRGFIRTYARFLGLDPEDAVERYNELLGDSPAATPGPIYMGPPPSSAGPSVWVLIAAAAALILVAFVGYSYYQFQAGQRANATGKRVSSTPTPVAAEAEPTVLPATSSAPLATPAASPGVLVTANSILIRVRQDSWLHVSIDGVQKIAGIVPAGTEKTYHGKSATVRAGNAAGVDILVNGKDVGILGAPGDVIERTFSLTGK